MSTISAFRAADQSVWLLPYMQERQILQILGKRFKVRARNERGCSEVDSRLGDPTMLRFTSPVTPRRAGTNTLSASGWMPPPFPAGPRWRSSKLAKDEVQAYI